MWISSQIRSRDEIKNEELKNIKGSRKIKNNKKKKRKDFAATSSRQALKKKKTKQYATVPKMHNAIIYYILYIIYIIF